jgi:hypothetical protein
MKKRYFAKKPKSLPKGYDSKLELRLHEGAFKGTQHHPSKEDLINYTIPHTYEYDFLFEHNNKMYVVEAKGRLRDSSEASKYKHIRDNLVDWHVYKNSRCTSIEIVLLFENANTVFPFAKKRSDGTKKDHGEWADTNDFRWLCEKRGDLDDIESLDDLVNKIDSMNKEAMIEKRVIALCKDVEVCKKILDKHGLPSNNDKIRKQSVRKLLEDGIIE